MAPQLLRPLFGSLLAAACGAALADACDDALVFRAITSHAREAATTSPRAVEALGGGEGPLEVGPWWRGAVSAPLRAGRGRGGVGGVASASFTVTGPAEAGSRAADVVVLAVAARGKEKKKKKKEEKRGEEGEGGEEATSPTSSSTSSSATPPPSLLACLSRRWSSEGWTLVSAEITLPRPGGLPGPATGVSLMEEMSKKREEEEKEGEKKKK